MPTCHECDIKMAVHMDDPPWDIFGLPRLLTSGEAIDKFLAMVNDPYNYLTLCSGSLNADPHNNVADIVRKHCDRIAFLQEVRAAHHRPGRRRRFLRRRADLLPADGQEHSGGGGVRGGGLRAEALHRGGLQHGHRGRGREAGRRRRLRTDPAVTGERFRRIKGQNCGCCMRRETAGRLGIYICDFSRVSMLILFKGPIKSA